MSKQNIHNLKNCYSSTSDEKLKKIVETDFADYLPEAINLAELELKERGVQFTHPIPGRNRSSVDQPSPRKTSTKILLRVLLFPVWLIFCIFLLGWFGMVRPEIIKGLLWLSKDVCGINDIETISHITGYGMIFFWILLVISFLISFWVMINITK